MYIKDTIFICKEMCHNVSTQSEAILENNLIKQLEKLEYEKVTIKDDKASRNANLKNTT